MAKKYFVGNFTSICPLLQFMAGALPEEAFFTISAEGQ